MLGLGHISWVILKLWELLRIHRSLHINTPVPPPYWCVFCFSLSLPCVRLSARSRRFSERLQWLSMGLDSSVSLSEWASLARSLLGCVIRRTRVHDSSVSTHHSSAFGSLWYLGYVFATLGSAHCHGPQRAVLGSHLDQAPFPSISC